MFDYSGPRPRFVDFIATFEQHCEGRVPALLGRLEMSDTAMPVAIDIKPNSSDNVLNLESAGVIPVAILSSATFDATTVDPTTVTLAGAKVRLLGKATHGSCGPDDVNGDGVMDLVCHVETAALFILPGDSVAVLEATTFSGDAIRGQDSIRIVKEKEF